MVKQEGCATVLNKLRPHDHREVHIEPPGVPDGGSLLKSSQSHLMPSPLSQLSSTLSAPSIKNSETEVNQVSLRVTIYSLCWLVVRTSLITQ